MSSDPKPLVMFRGDITSPPFSKAARVEAGTLLRRLQDGENLGMPHSRPMPDIGPRCHELRIQDENKTWRIFYRIDSDAILVVGIEEKKTRKTSKDMFDRMQNRLRHYDVTVKTTRQAKKKKKKR